MYLVKNYFLIGFHLKSFIKSLIFKLFFSAWSGRLAQKQAQSVPVRHSIWETDWGLWFRVPESITNDVHYPKQHTSCCLSTLNMHFAIFRQKKVKRNKVINISIFAKHARENGKLRKINKNVKWFYQILDLNVRNPIFALYHFLRFNFANVNGSSQNSDKFCVKRAFALHSGPETFKKSWPKNSWNLIY